MKSLFAALALFGPVCATTAEEAGWEPCGWGGGGWFWSAAADPKDADVFYMGGDVDGLWKTTDAGETWRFMNDGLPDYAVYSLAVAPSDPRTVYALTGGGVAVSTNGASAWRLCAETKKSALEVLADRGGSIHALAVDPVDPKTVYAGGKSGRVVKSTDGGMTWSALDYRSVGISADVLPSPASGTGFALISGSVTAADPHSRYFSVIRPVSESGADWSGYSTISCKAYLPASAPSGMKATIVVQSGSWTWAEGGNVELVPGRWTTLSFDVSAYTDPSKVQQLWFVVRPLGRAYSGFIGLDAFKLSGTDKELTLGEWDGTDREGWKKATDVNGVITERFATTGSPPDDPPGSAVNTIAVSGKDRNLVFVCHKSFGLFRSTDAGASWSKVSGAPGDARTVFWAGPEAPSTWYGAFGVNGVRRSTDDGLTWSAFGAPACSYPARDIVCRRDDPSVVHALYVDSFSCLIRSTRDGGATWFDRKSFETDHAANPTLPDIGKTGSLSGIENLAISPVDPDRILAPGNWDPCFSRDGGDSWQESCRGADITCFHDIRFLDGNVYGAAMDEGTCMSSDGGANWSALFPLHWQEGMSGHHWRVLPQKLADGRTRVVCTVSPWAGSVTYPVKVIVSEDGGKSFSVAKGLPDYRTHANTMWGEGHGRALAADPSDPDVLYLGIDGDPENGNAGGGIFKSTDGGRNWSQLANQPGSRRMYYGLAVDPTNPGRVVWGACGNKSGVYVSENGGESWSKASGVGDWIYNVEITPSGTIYASGNQLYRSTNHGKSFSTVSSFSCGGTVLGIAVDTNDENRVWASVAAWDDSAVGGVFESTDGCKTWTEITGDIPNRKPCVLRYDAASGYLWAAGPAAFKLKVDATEEESEEEDTSYDIVIESDLGKVERDGELDVFTNISVIVGANSRYVVSRVTNLEKLTKRGAGALVFTGSGSDRRRGETLVAEGTVEFGDHQSYQLGNQVTVGGEGKSAALVVTSTRGWATDIFPWDGGSCNYVVKDKGVLDISPNRNAVELRNLSSVSVENGGTLKTRAWKLVSGKVVFASGSALHLVANGSVPGKLSVNGAVSIAAEGTALTVEVPEGLAPGRYVLVSASKGITGTFVTVDFGGAAEVPRLSEDGKELYVEYGLEPAVPQLGGADAALVFGSSGGESVFTVPVVNAEAGCTYTVLSTEDLLQPFLPCGISVKAVSDGVLPIEIPTAGRPCLFIRIEVTR